jgi:predicted aspartyl protease
VGRVFASIILAAGIITPALAAGDGSATTPVPNGSVAQRVVLYEEDPNIPQGRRSAGSAVWLTEAISPGNGKPPELAVRADIKIPQRKMSIIWTLRGGTDQNRSISHTIEIMIKVPPDFSSGGILSIPGVWMKQAEQTQGNALAGTAIKVEAEHFLIRLNGAPSARERNLRLLKEPWFEIPIVYTNNRRAILAVEKGSPGERAFSEIFTATSITSAASIPPVSSIPMRSDGGIYVVPVAINGAITLDFVVDSGAASVSIPADVVLTLMRTGTIKQSDFLGQKTYVLADGSKVPSQAFRIRSLKVGDRVLEGVDGSIAPVQGALLLGQSFLSRFKSWSIDNSLHALMLE